MLHEKMQSGRLKMLLDEKEDWPNAVKTALWPITSLVELGMRKNWQEDSQLAEALKQGVRRILDLFGAMEREWVEPNQHLRIVIAFWVIRPVSRSWSRTVK